MTIDELFLDALTEEVDRARRKFPNQKRETTLLALMEEVGELAQAFLQGKPEFEIEQEAVQVATMAMRVSCDHAE